MKRMKKTFLKIAIFMLFLITAPVCYSVPAPQRLALNHETKECGMFWAGDEFTRYELPSGWSSYEINYTSWSVETEVGNCTLNRTSEEPFKECCMELSYKYIPGNIGKKSEEYILPALISHLSRIFAFIIALTIFLYFVIKKVKKK